MQLESDPFFTEWKWKKALHSPLLSIDLGRGTQPYVMVWSGLAWPGLAWPGMWSFLLESHETLSFILPSQRTAVILTTPKQTAGQPNLHLLLTGILKTVTVIRFQTPQSILSKINTFILPTEVWQVRICEGNAAGHVNMRHACHKSESCLIRTHDFLESQKWLPQ